MKEIKTREKVKDIKVLDRSAVVGQRMKNAFIRSKRNAAALMDDRQATPSEYAGDKVEFAADDLAHDTAMWPYPGQKRRYARGESCSSASGRSGRRRSAGKTPPPLNRPPSSNRPRVRPQRARPHSGTVGRPRRDDCPVSDPTRPGMGSAPGRAPAPPRTDGSHASEPGRPRSASTSHGMSAQRSGPRPLLTLSAPLIPQTPLWSVGGLLPGSRPQSGLNGNGR